MIQGYGRENRKEMKKRSPRGMSLRISAVPALTVRSPIVQALKASSYVLIVSIFVQRGDEWWRWHSSPGVLL